MHRAPHNPYATPGPPGSCIRRCCRAAVAVIRCPRMFQSYDHNSRCRCVDPHSQRRRCDDHAEAGIALPEMFFDHAALARTEMGIMERNAPREKLAQLPRSLRRISPGQCRQSILSRGEAQRIREILCAMACLARRLAEHDHLLAFLNQPLHKRDDPVPMLSFAVLRPNEPILCPLLPRICVKKPEATV